MSWALLIVYLALAFVAWFDELARSAPGLPSRLVVTLLWPATYLIDRACRFDDWRQDLRSRPRTPPEARP